MNCSSILPSRARPAGTEQHSLANACLHPSAPCTTFVLVHSSCRQPLSYCIALSLSLVKKVTWKQFPLWFPCFNGGADEGDPLVLGRTLVGVRAAEHVDVRFSVHLHNHPAVGFRVEGVCQIFCSPARPSTLNPFPVVHSRDQLSPFNPFLSQLCLMLAKWPYNLPIVEV